MSDDDKNVFKDFDLKTSILLRGETPEDINKQALKVCADYLGGKWREITAEQLILRRISGGLTNQIYYCALPENIKPENDEPVEVAIRLYGAKHLYNFDNEENERLSDTIIAILMSEAKIGPKIYGLFGKGEIQEYIQSHPFFEEEENNPEMVNELAKKLVQIHNLKVPIKKKIYYFEQFDQFYQSAYKKFPIDKYIEELNLENLKNGNLIREKHFIKKCVEQVNSPIVFVHNDFRKTNILVKEKNNEEEKLTICDYEYGNYGYRGYDFGTLFSSWGNTKFEFPPKFVSDEVLKEFFNHYLDECVRLNGKEFLQDERNSIDHLILETKIFTLSGFLFGTLFCLNIEENLMGFNKEKMMKGADMSMASYFYTKKNLIKEDILTESGLNNNYNNNNNN